MNKMFFAIPLIGMLLVFSSTALAHEGEQHGKEMYEEGSSGSSMGMDHKSDGHEYKGEHGGDHSKEYYEKKYGKKYDHEKHELKEEGSGMKDEAMKKKEMEHKRMEEGSKM
jgi:hypothetical protein